MSDEIERALEATLFAADEPLSAEALAGHLGGALAGEVREGLDRLQQHYRTRGVHLVERGGRWHFETAPDLAHVPVLVLTSRESEDDRRRGLDAGANGYLVKAAWDEHALLAAVRRLVGEGGTTSG